MKNQLCDAAAERSTTPTRPLWNAVDPTILDIRVLPTTDDQLPQATTLQGSLATL